MRHAFGGGGVAYEHFSTRTQLPHKLLDVRPQERVLQENQTSPSSVYAEEVPFLEGGIFDMGSSRLRPKEEASILLSFKHNSLPPLLQISFSWGPFCSLHITALISCVCSSLGV